MKRNIGLFLTIAVLVTASLHGQEKVSEEVTFCFVAGKDMLFSPYGSNRESLQRLSEFINLHRTEITSGEMPVRVYGYCGSGGSKDVLRRRVKIMSNRVKSEMITRDGLREEHFRTQNATEPYGGMMNVVLVRIALPQRNAVDRTENRETVTESEPVEAPRQSANTQNDAEQTVTVVEQVPSQPEVIADSPVKEEADTSLNNLQKATPAGQGIRRWSVGLNVGVPFFWGDMVSMSADKTYIGVGAGIQGGYLFSESFGVVLSIDYAHGKAGAHGYAGDYLLAPNGMTHYTPTDDALPYSEVYAKISLVNIGIGADINLNGLLSSEAVGSPFTVWLSPTVYGQMFSAKTYTSADDRLFSDKTTRPDKFSVGLGGALSLRYRIADAWSIQLKNTLLWMTDNKFDAVVTPYGHTRHNAMWMPQLGVVWMLAK